MDQGKFVEILKILVNYFIEIFKYFGYITQEDIDTVNGFIDGFTK